MPEQGDLESLYGYWVNCNDIFTLVSYQHDSPELDMSDEMKDFVNIHQSFYRLATAYGLLYVVVEGYQEPKLADNKIDLLLGRTEYVESQRVKSTQGVSLNLPQFDTHSQKGPIWP